LKQGFASSARKLDLSKVVLLGRLGNNPVLRTVSFCSIECVMILKLIIQTSSGKPYYSSAIPRIDRAK
jgi:hypothetical protein